MVEFVVVVVVVAEISDDDDKIDFENMDDDGCYYYQQLMMMRVVPLVDLIWINYLVDKAIKKRKKDIKFLFAVE
jgi:hypothetical protein